jgi:DNA-directed RNA polymerase specialized sigma24 family protein
METVEQVKRNVADFHWLATLLTGCRETATEVTFQALDPAGDSTPFFSTWMHAWSRRNVIARALAAVREDLARSARWMAARPVESREFPPQSWTLEQLTTKSDLERALLPIDVFPRAAVLLLAFERVSLKDAAVLLDSEPDLVRQALAAGARELTINLARMQGWKSPLSGSNTICEEHDVRSTEIPS